MIMCLRLARPCDNHIKPQVDQESSPQPVLAKFRRQNAVIIYRRSHASRLIGPNLLGRTASSAQRPSAQRQKSSKWGAYLARIPGIRLRRPAKQRCGASRLDRQQDVDICSVFGQSTNDFPGAIGALRFANFSVLASARSLSPPVERRRSFDPPTPASHVGLLGGMEA